MLYCRFDIVPLSHRTFMLQIMEVLLLLLRAYDGKLRKNSGKNLLRSMKITTSCHLQGLRIHLNAAP